MPLNQLPTDNLYKFMALSGLVLMGFSIVYPYQVSLRLSEDIAQYELASDLLRAELGVLNNWFGLPSSELVEEIRPVLPRLGEARAEEITQYIETQGGQLEWELELERKLTELHAQGQEVARLVREQSRVVLLGRLGSGAGAVFAVLGFLLWYSKVQVHLDAAVRRQAGTVEPEQPEPKSGD